MQEEIKDQNVFNFHRIWHQIQPIRLTNSLFLFGSKSFTKMIMFKDAVNLTNDHIDMWMSLGPKREAEEPIEDYKIRRNFQNALYKFRPYIYNFDNIN